MASDYTLPNLIKEEQRYINKSGSGGREMKKQRRKAEDKQRNKMQRFDRQYLWELTELWMRTVEWLEAQNVCLSMPKSQQSWV